MARLHVICRKALNVHVTQFPDYDSGDWDLSEADAKRLIGGTLLLHETKAEPAYFGGTVTDYRLVSNADGVGHRVVFQLTATHQAKGVSWEGADHDMAWSSGLIE